VKGRSFHLVSHWRLQATLDEVWQLVARPEDFPRWWPAAFTYSLPIQTGDETGAAKVVRLEGRGFLPLLLRWHAVATHVEPAQRLVNRVWGDFEGDETWVLSGDGGWVDLEHQLNVDFRSAVIRGFGPLGRALLAANHRWSMARGEESMILELRRRSALAEPVPHAPAGISRKTWALALGGAGLIALTMLGLRRTDRESMEAAREHSAVSR
jgi:uncharacterized protein YndB with AHSA1/START domain